MCPGICVKVATYETNSWAIREPSPSYVSSIVLGIPTGVTDNLIHSFSHYFFCGLHGLQMRSFLAS